MRHHRLFLHGRHGADGNGLLLRRQTAGVPQIRLSVLPGQRELPVVAREFHVQVELRRTAGLYLPEYAITPINTNNYVLFTSSISHYLSAVGGD